MKLLFYRLFKRSVYIRYKNLEKKIAARKNRLLYAKFLMDGWNYFRIHDARNHIIKVLNLTQCKKSHQLVIKLYNTNDKASLEKEFPL